MENVSSTVSTVSYLVKVDWVQRWAKACGELNHCEDCPDRDKCQRIMDVMIDRVYSDHANRRPL